MNVTPQSQNGISTRNKNALVRFAPINMSFVTPEILLPLFVRK